MSFAENSVNSFWEFGSDVSGVIFWFSSLLVRPEMPGWVAVLILVALLIAILLVGVSAGKKLNALRWLEHEVSKTKNQTDFAVQSPRIDAEAKRLRTRKGYEHISAA